MLCKLTSESAAAAVWSVSAQWHGLFASIALSECMHCICLVFFFSLGSMEGERRANANLHQVGLNGRIKRKLKGGSKRH